MIAQEDQGRASFTKQSFFDQPDVKVELLPFGDGVPLGIKQVFHSQLDIGGAYGTWGKPYDNSSLAGWIEACLGEGLSDEDRMDLAPLGFLHRHHTPELTDEAQSALEIEVGAHFLRAAARAKGWEPEEVEAVLIGETGPVTENYTEQVSDAAGIPEEALKVSVHKACDSSVAALNLLMNPDLPDNQKTGRNIARELLGKKVLVGGIEGLSRTIRKSRDRFAMQIFGNGAGIIGLIPGKGMRFLSGKSRELYDEEGVLALHMYYPHSRGRTQGSSMVEVSQAGEHHIRVAGLMHEPEGDRPVVMASPMGMVKLFVRTGVEFIQDFYSGYEARMRELGKAGKKFATVVVHHANLKINRLMEKHLNRTGIRLSLPWVLSDFGNVSAASNMIAFLRQLSDLKPGDLILFFGFGAGTYYDALAVALDE